MVVCNIIEVVSNIMDDILSSLDNSPPHISHHVETRQTQTTCEDHVTTCQFILLILPRTETGLGRKAAPATMASFMTWLVLWAT